ncbi:MAG: flagellar hook-basal body complex protein [Alphaproteobacteria bacterium]|nr:flagellar hook-basal body complex protein [Alphaproteobacteria bacterium]
MGLFGSLFTGVSALFGQSQNTAIISNNIANISTNGFKRSEASFSSLVTTESRLAQYSPGTVAVNRIQRVDQQGSIQQTSSSTDAAISGNGFFPVKRATTAGQEFLYTRAGQFSEDAQGLLRNAAGFVLYAWPVDSDGNLPANQGDLVSLVPADVAFLGGLTRPTSAADLAINLDADEIGYDPHNFSTPAELPVDSQSPHFSRGLTVFDALGDSHTLTIEYRKIVGPMAHFTSNAPAVLTATDTIAGLPITANSGVLGGITEGHALDITIGATTETFEFVQTAGAGAIVGANEVITVQDYIDAINAFGTGNELEARLTANGQILVQAVDPTATVIVANNTGTPATNGTGFNIVTDPSANNAAPDLTFEPDYDITGAAVAPYLSQSDFPQISNVTSPNTQGWWEMSIVHPNGSNVSQGMINFDGDGGLNAAADSSGNIDIELTNIDWGNGSDLQNINIDIGRFSQFSGNYDVIFTDQNGAELGLRTGIELTREGKVVARFSNGASADLYQIPLVTFSNSNGLTEVSGTAYSTSEESGEENLREAATGGAGFVEPSTLEASNVDLADEFARLIISQRAFGAGTRVITTVDQMTEDLLRLR